MMIPRKIEKIVKTAWKKSQKIHQKNKIGRKETKPSSHIAIIFKGGHVVTYGTSHKKTNSFITKYCPESYTTHAEIDAILKVPSYKRKKILKNSTMIIIRTSKQGQLLEACPCQMCKNVLKFFNIGYYYSNKTGAIKCQLEEH